MVPTRLTSCHFAMIWAALRPSVVVVDAVRNTYGCRFCGAVSMSVLVIGAMNSTLFSRAMGDTAGPSADVSVPTRKSTLSFRISSRDTRTASFASPLVSRTISCSFRPRTPPLALTSSTSICAPLTVGSPNSAPPPDRIIGNPTLIASCAAAGSDKPMTAPAAHNRTN
jgi:hypothetical protein